MREQFKQAYREARANGRIGYQVLNNPRARMAAAECMIMRCTQTRIAIMWQRYRQLEADLIAAKP